MKIVNYVGTLAWISGACAWGAGCSKDTAGSPATTLSAVVAPLDLPAATDVCYHLTVWNAADPDDGEEVWDQPALCASQYGANNGIRFTGICDAQAGTGDGDPDNDGKNAIRLILNDIYKNGDVNDGTALTAGEDYINPCPAPTGGEDNGCVLIADCEQNQDTKIEFNLTVMRQAELGFFDTVVKLQDVFCAAKLDCVDQNDQTLSYLPDPSNSNIDGPTAVLGFTCVTGDANRAASMYLDELVVTCTTSGVGGYSHRVSVNPAAGPGWVAPVQEAGTVPPILFGAAVNQGDASEGGVYWNVLLGMSLNAGETCTLTTRATVSELGLDLRTTPTHTRYPVIDWTVPLSTAGVRTCTRHPLNGGNGVGTVYTAIDTPEVFDHELVGCPIGLACDDGIATTINDTCLGAALGCRGTYCEGAECLDSAASASAAPGSNLSLRGVAFAVPEDGPSMSITSTTETPPTATSDGLPIDAVGPVIEFGPAGTTFTTPLTVSFEVGELTDVTLYTSEDGVNYAEVPGVTQNGSTLSFQTSHFSYYVPAGNRCKIGGNSIPAGQPCNLTMNPPGPCAEMAICQNTGSGCAATVKSAGTVCRAAAGLCDAAESCDGTAITCPSDLKRPNGSVCRAASGSCDLAELCNGAAVSCPGDALAGAGTACNDGSASTTNDVCDGSGGCAGVPVPGCNPADSPFGNSSTDGNGTSVPFKVCTPAHLDNVRTNLTASYVQTADIDLSSVVGPTVGAGGTPVSWNPIGAWTGGTWIGYAAAYPTFTKFSGTYDGAGFSISNLWLKSTAAAASGKDDIVFEGYGLFGIASGTIQNVTMINATVDEGNRPNIGALVGALVGAGKVANAKVTSGYMAGYVYVGGLVGRMQEMALLEDSSAAATVYSNSCVGTDGDGCGWGAGGLLGGVANKAGSGTAQIQLANSVIVRRSFATGPVSGFQEVGGLVGSMEPGPLLTQSFATGAVSCRGTYPAQAGPMCGGLVGKTATGTTAGTGVTDCYSIGSVTAVSANSGGYGGALGFWRNAGTFARVYSAPSAVTVSSTFWRGALVGWSQCNSSNTNLAPCLSYFQNLYYWNGASPLPNGLSPYGDGLDATQMATQGSFANFDFPNVWRMPSANPMSSSNGILAPVLAWQCGRDGVVCQ